MRVSDWPLSFKQLTRVGNLESNTVIVTLWTPLAVIQRLLNEQDYALLTQLYSKDVGLNALVRGCLANTTVRYLIVTGQDLSGSGQALLNLKQQGVDAQHHIIDSVNAAIDKEIPNEAIERFRERVEVIDLRSCKDFSQIKAELIKLPTLPDYGEPQTFPEAKIELPERFPSEGSAFPLRAKTVGEAWLQALQTVLKFGIIKESQRGEAQKELVDLMITVTDENPDAIAWKPYFNFTQDDLEKYYPQVISPQAIETVHYTYGKRLMDFRSKDQIASMIDELKRAPHTRRAIAVLWDVEQDMGSDDPPCFNLIQALIQEGKLHLTAYIRSNDIYDAWPRNAFALRKLQQRIASEAGYSLGHLTTISGSAHIYQRSIGQATSLLADHPVKDQLSYDLPGQLMQDKRGNITISTVGDTIMLTHLTVDGKRIEAFTAKTPTEAIRWLTMQQKLSNLHHAIYLGQELEKAALAIRYGLHYVQDKPLNMNPPPSI